MFFFLLRWWGFLFKTWSIILVRDDAVRVCLTFDFQEIFFFNFIFGLLLV